ncbi:MAG: hypothetical protein HY756_04120 [Nitrospirae bacterium]|nr:hypothetical protein [Nitrospirota bacterium]
MKLTGKNRGSSLLGFGIWLYVFFGLFVLVWLRTSVVKLEYNVGQLEKQKVVEARQRKFISAQRVSLYSVSRTEEAAIKTLGMGLPDRENVYFVKKVAGPRLYGASLRTFQDKLNKR